MIIPLLGLGVIVFTLVAKPPLYASVICAPDMFGRENCRLTDGLGGEWDKNLRKKHEAWFDVHTIPYEENSFPRANISGSKRDVIGAQIIEVTPYPGPLAEPESLNDQVRSLTGRRVDLVLGDNNDYYRTVNRLGCNELNFEKGSATYIANYCGVPNGVVSIRFTLTGYEAKSLENLRDSANKQISDARSSLVTHFVLGVPFFLVLFLLFSGVIWTVKRAARYISAG